MFARARVAGAWPGRGRMGRAGDRGRTVRTGVRGSASVGGGRSSRTSQRAATWHAWVEEEMGGELFDFFCLRVFLTLTFFTSIIILFQLQVNWWS